MTSQESRRLATISCELGDQVLLLNRLVCTERLSEPFQIVLDVDSQGRAVDYTKLLGKPFSVTMDNLFVAGKKRAFHGLLFEASYIGDYENGTRYRLVLRPWLSLLAGNLNSRIFQDEPVLKIIETLIVEAGFSAALKIDATYGYKPRPYCVQFRESDFAFISRLMEEEGLYYYFEHKAGDHILHICDKVGQNPDNAALKTTPFNTRDVSTGQVRDPHLWRWAEKISAGARKVILRDYTFLAPENRFEAQAVATEPASPGESAEVYDFAGGYTAYSDKEFKQAGKDIATLETEKTRFANIRLEASRAERRVLSGEGDAFALTCGTRFHLKNYPTRLNPDPFNIEYLLIGATHVLGLESYRSGASDTYELEVEVEAVPGSIQWRPRLKTPKPVSGGPQTAKVVGKDGKDIDVDELGRVKVQFYWDRNTDRSGDKRSIWVRVSQGWADSGFGTMMIPRIGEEVIVDFIDGDPDCPIITGRVYNADRAVPYALPEHMTRSTFKSHTVGKSGSYPEAVNPPPADNGFNELRFEDKGGEEEVFIHAQRDMLQQVRFDDKHVVGRDTTSEIGRDIVDKVKRNVSADIGQDRDVKIANADTLTIDKGDQTITLKKGDAKVTVEMGDYSLNAKMGKIEVEAMTSIELKVGGNSIKISQSGIEIKGMTVSIKADTALSAQGLTSELKATTAVTINGVMVNIN